eukprot:SAG31_NODE_729_length_12511_cov_7.059293_6_plen_200_part_00
MQSPTGPWNRPSHCWTAYGQKRTFAQRQHRHDPRCADLPPRSQSRIRRVLPPTAHWLAARWIKPKHAGRGVFRSCKLILAPARRGGDDLRRPEFKTGTPEVLRSIGRLVCIPKLQSGTAHHSCAGSTICRFAGGDRSLPFEVALGATALVVARHRVDIISCLACCDAASQSSAAPRQPRSSGSAAGHRGHCDSTITAIK